MKRGLFLVMLLVMASFVVAQPGHVDDEVTSEKMEQLKTQSLNSTQMNINTFGVGKASKINRYIDNQNTDRSILATMGMAVLGTLVSHAAGIAVDEVMDVTEIRGRQREAWEEMIENECSYEEDLEFMGDLEDFYSKGSSKGALDASDINFNGFTLISQRLGEDVLRFYCHLDTTQAGLVEIAHHSKFRLVLDSMYFYPYRCHLPNYRANGIDPSQDTKHRRSTQFDFEEREDLTVGLSFTITSSWYNQATMLAKDVELGTFSVSIPITEDVLTDSVFVYKKGMPNMPPMSIAGDCFLVPRSYMPLSNGAPHWGTGAYNLSVSISEECRISPDIKRHWKRDYRQLRRMKDDREFWPSVNHFCVQSGTTLLRCTLETATHSAIGEWDWLNSGR